MKNKFLLVAVALCVTGCNSDPGSRREIAMLRAEIQDLEDSYYRLKSECGDEVMRKPVRRSNPDIQWQEDFNGAIIEYPPQNGEIIYDEGYSPSLSPQFNDPQPLPNRLPANQPQNDPEEIDILPSGNSGQSSADRSSAQNRLASSPNRPGQNNSAGSTTERPTDLLLIPDQTIPVDTSGDGKPDGIQATFALKNRDGNNLSEPAKLIFSLLDPARPTGSQRIGFWEHTTAGNGSALSLDPAGEPEQVFLPWQSVTPSNGELLLFVRHMRSDGTALEANVPILPDAIDEQLIGNNSRQIDRSAGKAPEIMIDTGMLEQENSKKENRRPLWRATR